MNKKAKLRFSRDRLRAFREFHQLSHKDFADQIGKSRSAVINWENGKGSPSALDLDHISSVFDVEPVSFWTTQNLEKVAS